MPNLRNDYTEGVGKTVLDLFKKVFQVKKDYLEEETGTNVQSQTQINTQTGGAVEEPIQGHVKLTNVAQYYDGTIYEGIINYTDKYDISFNIKDRTKGLFEPEQTSSDE